MRKPTYSTEEIIAKGEALAIIIQGPVEPWRIHQELGGKGRLDRVRDIWVDHCADRKQIGQLNDVPLPADVENRLELASRTFRQEIDKIVAQMAAGLFEEHRRQSAIQQRDHSEQVIELTREIDGKHPIDTACRHLS